MHSEIHALAKCAITGSDVVCHLFRSKQSYSDWHWCTVSWAIGNKFQWNFKLKEFSYRKLNLKRLTSKMVAILSLPQHVDQIILLFDNCTQYHDIDLNEWQKCPWFFIAHFLIEYGTQDVNKGRKVLHATHPENFLSKSLYWDGLLLCAGRVGKGTKQQWEGTKLQCISNIHTDSYREFENRAQVTHFKCSSKPGNNYSNKYLSPVRCQDITWNNTDCFEILIQKHLWNLIQQNVFGNISGLKYRILL